MQALEAGPAPAPRHQVIVGTALGVFAMFMLAGGMLGTFALQRSRALDLGEPWVPSGSTIPEVASNIMLISFAALCVFAQWAVWSARRNDRGHAVFALAATAVVAILVINAQAAIYAEMELGIGDGTYAAMFYAITGMFIVLMIVGLIYTAVAAFRFIGGRSDGDLVAAHALYWYAVAAVFAAIWFVVYVTK